MATAFVFSALAGFVFFTEALLSICKANRTMGWRQNQTPAKKFYPHHSPPSALDDAAARMHKEGMRRKIRGTRRKGK
jgi:hypothetical protein